MLKKENHRRDDSPSLTSRIKLKRFSFLYEEPLELFRKCILILYFPWELFGYLFKQQDDIKLNTRLFFGLISYVVDTTKNKNDKDYDPIRFQCRAIFGVVAVSSLTAAIPELARKFGRILPNKAIDEWPEFVGIQYFDGLILIVILFVSIVAYSLFLTVFVSFFTNRNTNRKQIRIFATYTLSTSLLVFAIGLLCFSISFFGLIVFLNSTNGLIDSPWIFTLMFLTVMPLFICGVLSFSWILVVLIRLFVANPIIVLSEVMGQESWRIAFMYGVAILLVAGVSSVVGFVLHEI